MAFWDDLVEMFSGQGGQSPEDVQRAREQLTLGGRTQGQPFGGALGEPQMGMEAFPMGPGGRGPISGSVSGALPVPGRAPAGALGRGQTYEGTATQRFQDLVRQATGGGGRAPGGPQGGMAPGQGPMAPGAPGGQPRLTDQGIIYGQSPGAMPGGAGAVPGGGGAPPRGSAFGVAPGAQGAPGGGFSGFLRDAWRNMSPFGQAGAIGAGAGAGATLWDMLGGGPDATETSLLGQPRPPGTGRSGVPMRNELPAAYTSEIMESIPGVDYDALPRPDFEAVRAQLAQLAPEAPEEANWLDKTPSYMKNIVGMGILLGPIGLLLGAGLGMAENKRKEEAEQEAFKQQSRQHLSDMLGFDLKWNEMERSVAESERAQAIQDVELERSMQQWGIEDAQALQNLQLGDLQIGAAQRQAAQGPDINVDEIFNRALLTNPQGVFQMYQGITGSEDFPVGATKQEQEMLDQIIKANIASAFMGQR